MTTLDSVIGFMKDCLIGGTAGGISKTVGAPLERAKLLLQTQSANEALEGRTYNGLVDCMKRIYIEEGFLAYWRGNWANVVRYFPTTALNFGFKGFYNNILPQYDNNKNPTLFIFSKVLAGGLAGGSCMLFVYPLDFARTRLGVDVSLDGKRKFNGLTHCLTSIYKADGVRGLYPGIEISLFSIFIYRGLYFGGYDVGKKKLFTDYENTHIVKKLLFAQAVTNFSEILSYPFDTIRRRMMMNSGRDEVLYKNTLDCFK